MCIFEFQYTIMISVITGDIINSRKINSEEWLPVLKHFFQTLGHRPKTWDIFRGDSFQIESSPEESLEIVIKIKALIKQIKDIDVRMSIGLGEVNYVSDRVTESYGSAYIKSGEGLDNLKKYKLDIHSPIKELDDYFGVITKLLSFIMDSWKPATAETIFYALTYPNFTQKELSKFMKKQPSTISEALKRGGYQEVQAAINLFKEKITDYV